jgi:hypothetical protein
MLKSNKWQIMGVFVILALGLIWVPTSSLKSEEKIEKTGISINNINFGSLILGEEVSKEDMQDCVVGVLIWGKW